MSVQEALRNLYRVDTQLRSLKSRVSGASAHANSQQGKIDKLQAQIDDLQEQFNQTHAKESNIETEIQTFEDRINKLRDQMNTARTNKEYSALLLEVNTLKTDKSKIEDQALSMLGKADELKTQLDGLKQQLEEQSTVKDMADKELSEREADIAERLAELEAEREKATSQVPKDILDEFEKLQDAHDGEAMAEVIEADRRYMEYTCEGCYMLIPPERVNQLASTDSVVNCASCGRILFIEEETREILKK